jgi:hypothetical protein
MRDYAIGRFANFISGDVSREEFYIFTGSGSNGKSKSNYSASFGILQITYIITDSERAAAGTP